MLKTRVITALVLLVILLPILFLGNYHAFAIVALIFFGAAIWECQRLFEKPLPIPIAVLWTLLFAYFLFHLRDFYTPLLFALSSAFWLVRLLPLLRTGLPQGKGFSIGILSTLYGIGIFSCFSAIAVLFTHSSAFLLSVMAVVWVADIGAYFAGRKFGKHKLAMSISPGKSWEGAIGGWLFVLILSVITCLTPALQDSLPVLVQQRWGWLGLLLCMTVFCAASVAGDLFESMLKRRVGMKDSSQLLPGHGGVLDRIDALLPVLPLAALLIALPG